MFFEGGIRVPKYAAWPIFIQAGTRSAARLRNVDFMPMFAELAGTSLPTDQPVDGRSPTNVLRGQTDLHNRAIFWHYPLYLPGSAYNQVLPIIGIEQLNWRAVPSSIIRKGDYKLIHDYEYDNYKLFNLRDDSSEKMISPPKSPEKQSSYTPNG